MEKFCAIGEPLRLRGGIGFFHQRRVKLHTPSRDFGIGSQRGKHDSSIPRAQIHHHVAGAKPGQTHHAFDITHVAGDKWRIALLGKRLAQRIRDDHNKSHDTTYNK